MTQGLVNVFSNLLFLLTRHTLGVLPVVLVKSNTIHPTVSHRNVPAFLIADSLNVYLLLCLGLLLQVTEHGACIPPTVLRVKKSTVRQLNVFTLRVRVLYKKIDDVITRHVRQLRPLFVQLLPHSCMTERFV